MSEGYTSSPSHTMTEVTMSMVGPGPGQSQGPVSGQYQAQVGGVDPRVRFSTQSREEVSLYGTPREEIMPNVNSSR